MSRSLLFIGLLTGLAAFVFFGCNQGNQKTPVTKVNTETVSYSVSGMTCSKCVARVKDALSKVDGVSGSEVNLEKGRADVQYDPVKTNEKVIEDALKTTGFEIAILQNETETSEPKDSN